METLLDCRFSISIKARSASFIESIIKSNINRDRFIYNSDTNKKKENVIFALTSPSDFFAASLSF